MLTDNVLMKPDSLTDEEYRYFFGRLKETGYVRLTVPVIRLQEVFSQIEKARELIKIIFEKECLLEDPTSDSDVGAMARRWIQSDK